MKRISISSDGVEGSQLGMFHWIHNWLTWFCDCVYALNTECWAKKPTETKIQSHSNNFRIWHHKQWMFKEHKSVVRLVEQILNDKLICTEHKPKDQNANDEIRRQMLITNNGNHINAKDHETLKIANLWFTQLPNC